jgi:GT2 family glycosyltransferase
VHVSVIVPTYKRPESLSRCLDALAAQDIRPDEVLVVVRDEDESSRRCVEARRDEPIRLVSIAVPAGHPGFVAALNAGVDASSGEIVCLTDDDAQPRRDWISRILATYAADPKIGAVGGRDWVYHDDLLEDGAELKVGTLSPWGYITGNHHLGVGPPRDVAVLKGVNFSVRGRLIREVGFDARLRGVTTENHPEIGLCLKLARNGYRVIYDPTIAVDHRPQPRVDEDREFGARQVRASSHNETLALLEYLPLPGKAAHLLWTIGVGSRGAPGLAQAARLLLSTGNPRPKLLWGNLTGRGLAVLTYLRSRRSLARSQNLRIDQ